MNNKTPISPLMALKHFQELGTRDEILFNITKESHIAVITQKIERNLRAVSQELWMKTKYTWEIYFGHLSDQIYVFLINHKVAVGYRIFVCFSVWKSQIFNYTDFNFKVFLCLRTKTKKASRCYLKSLVKNLN